MDVLTDLLERSRARGAAFAHSTVHGPWGLAFEPGSGLAVHAVVAGRAAVWLDGGGEAVELGAGDVVLVRGDQAHRMASAPGASCVALEAFAAAAVVPGAARRFVVPGGGEPTVFLCGAYRFAGELCSALLASLPPVVRVSPPAGGRLRAALDLLARELDEEQPGQQAVLDRLLDVVLVGVLRDHLGRTGAGAPAWYAALDDPEVGGALRRMHAEPARSWTVGALATEVGLSRAAFARRFSARVGEAPLEYLTRWRMALARERLREDAVGLSVVAREVGYSNEFAFAAAFKRHHGQPPGAWRARARADARAATSGNARTG